MRQNDLNRAVARATGETVDRIQQLGFQIVRPPTQAQRSNQRILRFRRKRLQRPPLTAA